MHVYITEYASMAYVQGQAVPIALDPPVAEQTVDITGLHVESAPFSSSTRFIRINTDSTCSIVIGAAPVATIASGRFATNQTEFRGVLGGHKLSVIANS